jgi:hypothetical protein
MEQTDEIPEEVLAVADFQDLTTWWVNASTYREARRIAWWRMFRLCTPTHQHQRLRSTGPQDMSYFDVWRRRSN